MGGVSPIPFVAIDAWARRSEVSGEAFTRLQRLIRAMDAVWLEDAAQKGKAAAKR